MAFSTGYNQTFLSRIEDTLLPEKIQCATCKKHRGHLAFSQSQLQRACQSVANYSYKRIAATTVPPVRCIDCIAKSNVEMKCVACYKIKGIDEFSKAQRHHPDDAVCFNCVQTRLETDAPLVAKDNDIETSTVAGSLTITNPFEDDDFSIPPSNYRRAHYPGSHRVDSGVGDHDEDCSVGGGVWLGEQKDAGKSGYQKYRGQTFTAFDANGVGHHRMASETKPSTQGTYWLSSASNSAQVMGGFKPGRTGGASPRRNETKFAKVPRGHPTKLPRIPESMGRVLADDDENESYP